MPPEVLGVHVFQVTHNGYRTGITSGNTVFIYRFGSVELSAVPSDITVCTAKEKI